MKQFFLIVFLIGGFSVPSFSEVNTRNGSFRDTWIDIIVPGKGYNFKIDRHYSSRSLYSGIFGFGWCSPFETKILRDKFSQISILECGGGIEKVYYPENFDKGKKSQFIQKIVKLNASRLSTLQSSRLRSRLNEDPFFRYEMAKKHGLLNFKELKKAKKFVSRSSQLEVIDFQAGTYTRKIDNGRIQKFDGMGKLVQLKNSVGHWLKIVYKNEKIQYIHDDLTRRLTFFYNRNGSLKKITDGKGLEIVYTFERENLVSVKNAWNNTYSFKYDNFQNLVRVNFPDQTFIAIHYDAQKDWVKTFQNRIKCIEEYQFILSPESPKDHYWANVEKKCGDKNLKARYEFWYKVVPNQTSKYLSRMRKQIANDFLDSSYHEKFGLPVTIEGNQFFEKNNYSRLGLKSRSEFKNFNITTKGKKLESWYSLGYSYDKIKHSLNEVIKTEYLSTGKVKNSSRTKYQYSKKGLLAKVSRGKNMEIQIDYNNYGKITKLQKPANQSFLIAYDRNFGKPRQLVHNQLGTIDIQYDLSGDISKVQCARGEQRAQEIVDEFLIYVDVLGPASEGIKI